MKVLFVCAGNICRSPIAEAAFRHHAAFHAPLQDVTVSSAGVAGLEGDPATAGAVDAARSALGLDIGRHRARRLSANDDADLVLTLDAWVQARVAGLGLGGVVAMLGDYAGWPGEEVEDPYGGPIEGYRTTAAQISRLVRAAAARLSRERAGFDLAAYFERLGLADAPRADVSALQRIHRAHVQAIPFENLDIQLGRRVHLDVSSLQDKLVRRRRGGYCFEQNTLLQYALRSLGFDVIACEARVRTDGGAILPRTHMVLLVTLDGERWLCDVGFGGDGPIEPVRLGGEPQRQFLWDYRLVEQGPLQVLQLRRPGGWADLYAFVPEPRYPVDFQMANWFTSTWPDSRFVLTLTAQRSTPEARYVLRNLQLAISDAGGTRTREIARADLVPLLRDTMRIDVPDTARFLALDG